MPVRRLEPIEPLPPTDRRPARRGPRSNGCSRPAPASPSRSLDDEPAPRGARRGHVRVAIARPLRSSPIRSSSTCSPTRPMTPRSGPRPRRPTWRTRPRRWQRGDDPLRALRRWKRREFLRIAARDLLGIAGLPVVARELAALAEVCLARALDVAAPQVPFVVVGMGKLGGRELNYASDVDVLFVHDGRHRRRRGRGRVARAVMTVMTEPTPDGIVFRTDADLRPEGRAGPLTRSLDSYASYYDRWAQTWEFQALIKARPGRRRRRARPAGSWSSIGRHVWPDVLDPTRSGRCGR